MRRLSALLASALVAYPLLIAPTTANLAVGGAAMALCALGIGALSPPVVVAGEVLILGEYTLALWLSAGPPRLAGAVLLGIGLVLLLETVDFARRTRHAAKGPGVIASQLRYWATFGALGVAVTLVVVGISTAASLVVRLPWAPAFAAAGAAVALVAVTLALRRRHS